ncbi:hypothetical protein HPP92_018184 [Vanilla planifolia]|uniref:DUF4378 domain-containing protein n=1 Tax=Vanilla planifolia TaxID=51239 RepID=A0A835QDL2_VANPL|nr:hypothetical protein HPP92_018773 [Vanilla planifolia]KAG0468856.1 hypothetical protein HPP92_018184 [Vanilla planifolia]
MGSFTQGSLHGRPLFELLDEQQEPFLLETYLLDSGYSCSVLKSRNGIKCWPIDGCRRFLGFDGHGLKRKVGGALSCILHKLLHPKPISRKTTNWEGTAPILVASTLNWLSLFREEDGKKQLERMHEPKEQSPVSVLELQLDEGCSATKPPVEEEKATKLQLYSSNFSKLYWQRDGNKVLFNSKQHVLQHEEEVEERIVDTRESLEKRRVFSLEKKRSHVARVKQWMDLDVSRWRMEWSHFPVETRDIGMEIEGFIFEEIKEEAFVEMLGLFACLEKGVL